ncbi:hypothetical protein SDC9_183807 [bioreactor metagenome]|uniref:Uncharacterized protein n=1 Tax=bioreactor metagenome TaxID=1076179 RepID=A0A645HB91_9ZZZZ
MQQEYGIVEGYRKLQNIARRIRNKGNFAKYQIGARIDQYRDSQASEDDQRLQPGSRRQQENSQHKNHGDAGDLGYFGNRA